MIRDEDWLASIFHDIWDSSFTDVQKKNNVFIRWKGKWKNKFGHIKLLKNKDTEICINSFFQDLRVPEFVVRLTIAHEIVHYLHGFQSPHPRLFNHPHKGGIVNKELKRRGYGDYLIKEKDWYKQCWLPLYKEISRKK